LDGHDVLGGVTGYILELIQKIYLFSDLPGLLFIPLMFAKSLETLAIV
jgi:hypothetical protein